MRIQTTRFGSLEIESADTIRFPHGLMGLEHCRQWVLLADAQNDALGWLQSTSDPGLAFAVVSPRRFVPAYQVRVSRSELTPLELEQVHDAQVLVIVGKNDSSITLNLKAPLVIHLDRRLGKQVVNNADAPLQYELAPQEVSLRKSA